MPGRATTQGYPKTVELKLKEELARSRLLICIFFSANAILLKSYALEWQRTSVWNVQRGTQWNWAITQLCCKCQCVITVHSYLISFYPALMLRLAFPTSKLVQELTLSGQFLSIMFGLLMSGLQASRSETCDGTKVTIYLLVLKSDNYLRCGNIEYSNFSQIYLFLAIFRLCIPVLSLALLWCDLKTISNDISWSQFSTSITK